MRDSELIQFQSYLSGVRRLSQRSVVAYVADVREYLAMVGCESGAVALQGFIDRSCQLASGTVRRKVAAVRCYFQFCDTTGRGGGGNVSVTLPKLQRRLPRALSTQQMRSVLKSASDFSVRDQIFVHLGYSAGLRVGEIAMLRMNNIDLHRNMIRVVGKGQRDRIIPIGLELGRLISQYIRIQAVQMSRSSDFLFSSTGANGVSTRTVQLVIKRVLVMAGLTGNFSAHSLRHAAATHLLTDGATVRDVQSFLGHERLSTTQIYTQLVSSQLRVAVQNAHPRY